MKECTILVVENDLKTNEILTSHLTHEGFHVLTAHDYNQCTQFVLDYDPDLIILNVHLPGLNGFEYCIELRRLTEVPIILISESEKTMDKILGLSVGGDDYVTKPFNVGEILARIKANLRRYRSSFRSYQNENVIRYPGLEIDLKGFEVRLNNKKVYMSSKEFNILALLAKHPDKVFSSSEIYEKVWNMDDAGDIRTVMVHISTLRRKIEPNPINPKYIVTVRGIGYKFNSGSETKNKLIDSFGVINANLLVKNATH